jgi:acetylornithine deacetylase/succinyl-diaminopimelate desuccinylase-like protein
MTIDWANAGEQAVEHLRAMLRLDTTNPPGNEMLAVDYLAAALQRAGIESTIVAMTPGRGNLVARLKGSGQSEPLLLYGHMDVVPVEPEKWRHPPFAGDLAEGMVWGRGAIDMKGMLVQSLMVMLLLKQEGVRLKRDLIFAATADEEVDGAGIKQLVVQAPELIRAGWGITETGGFPMYVAGRRLYPVKTAEKGTLWLTVRAHGRPGHASMPPIDNPVARLSAALARLARRDLRFALTEHSAGYLRALGKVVGGELGSAVAKVKDTRDTRRVMRRLGDPQLAGHLYAVLHNTAVPTVVRAGQKTNVIPSEAEAKIDCRSLPGVSGDQLLEEVKAILGAKIEISVDDSSPPLEVSTKTPLYEILGATLRAHDREAIVTPYMMGGATDAKHIASLGVQTYGFSPLFLEPGEPYSELVHAHDERIPVRGFTWGLHVLYDAVHAFCAAEA